MNNILLKTEFNLARQYHSIAHAGRRGIRKARANQKQRLFWFCLLTMCLAC